MNAAQARSIGQQILGPIFTGWGHLLLRSAKDRRLRKLFFVARDGFLLQKVCAILIEQEVGEEHPQLEYLHLSRRSTQLPAYGRINVDGIIGALAVRAGSLTLASLLEYHGIGESRYLPVLGLLGVAPQTPVTSPAQALGLLSATELVELVHAEAAAQREALLDYLQHQDGIAEGFAGLVDIGWGGSIQHNLSRVLLSLPHLRPPAGIYLGLWREDGVASQLPNDADGLIGDLRRRRCLRESAPWQAAFLLEAVCRANEGTTQRFEMIGGRVTPILAESGRPARSAETSSNALAESVREGILAHVGHHARDDHWQRMETRALRRELQDRLLRLAFFPDANEIALGECLIHTESHDLVWNTTLILPRPTHPLRSPHRWLAGLASPWRGGYVMATGRAPAWLYRQLESLLLTVPARMRQKIRQFALRLARSPTASP